MTKHSPPPGIPQTAAKAWSGALAFILTSLVLRVIEPFAPDVVEDPAMIEAIRVVIAAAVGGLTAYLVPNKPLPPKRLHAHPLAVGLALAVVLAGCGTKVTDLDGRNGRNSLGLILIDADAPYPAAVWAQERFEQAVKRDALTRPGRLIEWAFYGDDFKRRLELASHEVEVQTAGLIYGLDMESYRLREARMMAASESYDFDGLGAPELAAKMAANAGPARRWVERNRAAIEAHR